MLTRRLCAGFFGPSTPALVAVNPFSSVTGGDFVRNHALPAVDFATIHSYADQWLTCSEDCLLQFTVEWYSAHLAAAGQLGKPLLNEEFGRRFQPQPVVDALFKAVYDVTHTAAAAGGPAGGDMLWVLASNGAVPNWDGYTLYPSNTSTCELVAAHVARMARLDAMAVQPRQLTVVGTLDATMFVDAAAGPPSSEADAALPAPPFPSQPTPVPAQAGGAAPAPDAGDALPSELGGAPPFPSAPASQQAASLPTELNDAPPFPSAPIVQKAATATLPSEPPAGVSDASPPPAEESAPSPLPSHKREHLGLVVVPITAPTPSFAPYVPCNNGTEAEEKSC